MKLACVLLPTLRYADLLELLASDEDPLQVLELDIWLGDHSEVTELPVGLGRFKNLEEVESGEISQAGWLARREPESVFQ